MNRANVRDPLGEYCLSEIALLSIETGFKIPSQYGNSICFPSRQLRKIKLEKTQIEIIPIFYIQTNQNTS
ncbi:hypothetical protein LEP1GSC038_2449 [Leptospira weilii str. 2006001855]|uniref:Uncharacterized protein n=1 Tax=Leptospira weilii str. 2006001855 TaxID=996804 RepID=M6FWC2_9LEPT|nr:hypothetical protein LEP1GSC038_2449 [Leptospira weilii str. 2006001855]